MSAPRRTGLRRGLGATATLAVMSLLGACAVLGTDETPVPAPAASASPTAAAPGTPATCDDATTSYDPSTSDLRAGSTVARIKKRGRLVAGVSADSYLLGARDPLSGRIQGFDIDFVRAMAEEVLGDADRYQLVVITAAQRIPALESGQVDLVARNMTMTCDRWEQIAFSSEYYRAGQKVLVRLGSRATSLADLAGQRVCAPNGTSSMDNLVRLEPDAIAVGSDSHTGCLVLFQQGQVDAITGDDTVLAGLAAQDPYAVVPEQEAFTAEPYGLGMNADAVDLVRVVNARLAEMRADGEWTKIYDRWFSGPLGPAPQPPKAVYGRRP
ncbi:amino acid ABC transporter substrate-binding protein, PAAT family [Microlunatus sagamiharensis]|uniref:Amino acid ABC transporter substrate-binding protein, PAAT family n=1 Tax=Microlunatus sagamiharensis TaxID=546874 RepID=A0A1H2MDA7_9ACTN|nr:glutamate ABC transporter substrate-binding protein [Microlunatus sagamiharensis]SDU91005.1 amino acid ABC transporter substrate-binding protein, PAAT family [Microlunatus sagamiharensis]